MTHTNEIIENNCPIDGTTDGNCIHLNYRRSIRRFATSIDAIEILRIEKGDGFATADEMEMLRNDPDYRRDVLAGVKIDEYDAEAKANADRAAAELMTANRNATLPEGFELVETGTIKAGYISWDKADGGFVTYNFDAPEIMVSQCFLVGRPMDADEFAAAVGLTEGEMMRAETEDAERRLKAANDDDDDNRGYDADCDHSDKRVCEMLGHAIYDDHGNGPF